MKKNILHKLAFAISIPLVMLACDSDDDAGLTTDFASISSNYYEADGTGSVTIPLRGSANGLDISLGGTAVEGEDYTVEGITDEGVTLSILDDDDLEDNETIRVQLTSAGGNLTGNSIHTVHIISNCADTDGLVLAEFAGDYDAIEKYGPNPPAANWYGPYAVTITQDATNPNRFNMTDFYDSGRSAYFLVDIAAGTVHFPNQTPLPDASPNLLSNSTGTFSLCEVEGHLTISINLNYDGVDWVYYFEKH
jgi:hypothetical protein